MNRSREAATLEPEVDGEYKPQATKDALVIRNTGIEKVVFDDGAQEQQPERFEQQVQSLKEAAYRHNLNNVTQTR